MKLYIWYAIKRWKYKTILKLLLKIDLILTSIFGCDNKSSTMSILSLSTVKCKAVSSKKIFFFNFIQNFMNRIVFKLWILKSNQTKNV